MIDTILFLAALWLVLSNSFMAISYLIYRHDRRQFIHDMNMFASDEYCMCGTAMHAHCASDNHAPISEWEYACNRLGRFKFDFPYSWNKDSR